MAYVREYPPGPAWPLSWLLETETRSKNGWSKYNFGQAHDSENRAAHLHQEFIGVFTTLTHVSYYLTIFWSYFSLPYLEPINTFFTKVVRSP